MFRWTAGMVGLKFNTVPIFLLLIIFHETIHVQSLRSLNSELKHRNKRETGTLQAIPDQSNFIDAVNKGRGNVIPTASKMTCMNWDDTLAKKAQAKAVTCDKSGQSQTQAITLDSSVKTLSQALTKWSNELYDLFSNFCLDTDDPTCINYKLVYNDQASTVGCAIASCTAGFMTVCEFGSSISSAAPYTNGPKTCTGCPTAFSECFNKQLCSVSATTCLGSTQTSSSAMSDSTSTSAHSTKDSTTTTKPSTPSASTSTFSNSISVLSTKPSTPSTQPPTSSSSTSTSTSTSTTSSPPKSTSTSPPTTKQTTPSTPTTKPPTSSSTSTTSTPKRSTSPPTAPCADTLTTSKCTQALCDSSPGTMYKQCRQTCGNCDGCTCKDSTTLNCTYYASFDYCEKYTSKMTEYCPVTCKLCNSAKSSVCTKVF